MKNLLIIFFLFGTISLLAQQDDSILVKEIPTIKNNVFQQRQDIDALSKKLDNQQYVINKQNSSINELISKSERQKFVIDSLNQLIQKNNTNIITNSQELGTKIQQTGEKANAKISKLDSSVNTNRLSWIFGSLGMLLLGGLMYLFLGKRIRSSQTDVEIQIKNTKKSLEEESIKLDSKLIGVLETQLKIKQEEAKASNNKLTNGQKIDHSLALKVADEIIRIQKNLGRMDETTRGLKQLNSSVKRIQDNFAANGYELIDMLGKEYNEGMKVKANFIPNENIETGKEIITRIIKPQVNYEGEMVQAAQIEVSIGE